MSTYPELNATLDSIFTALRGGPLPERTPEAVARELHAAVVRLIALRVEAEEAYTYPERSSYQRGERDNERVYTDIERQRERVLSLRAELKAMLRKRHGA